MEEISLFFYSFKFLSLILVRKEPRKLNSSSQSYKSAFGGALCNSKGKKDRAIEGSKSISS